MCLPALCSTGEETPENPGVRARPRSAAQGFRPDYLYLLQRLCMDNPEGAVNLAKTVARQPGPPIDLNTMADLFLQRNMVREATAFLLDVLQDNAPEHDKLQTKVGLPEP